MAVEKLHTSPSMAVLCLLVIVLLSIGCSCNFMPSSQTDNNNNRNLGNVFTGFVNFRVKSFNDLHEVPVTGVYRESWKGISCNGSSVIFMHKCSACYKQYKKKEDLVKHMRESYHSIHQPKCGVCQKYCKSFESLREHLTGPLPKANCSKIFIAQGCDLCMNIFDSLDARDAHKEMCHLSPSPPFEPVTMSVVEHEMETLSLTEEHHNQVPEVVTVDCEMVISNQGTELIAVDCEMESYNRGPLTIMRRHLNLSNNPSSGPVGNVALIIVSNALKDDTNVTSAAASQVGSWHGILLLCFLLMAQAAAAAAAAANEVEQQQQLQQQQQPNDGDQGAVVVIVNEQQEPDEQQPNHGDQGAVVVVIEQQQEPEEQQPNNGDQGAVVVVNEGENSWYQEPDSKFRRDGRRGVKGGKG